ncbi:hypothetical protein HAX54_044557 [Datura stramonium]|uniref:Uncharacterized protein n=1 Tax=Datura stramonium TaxID=4076 RepID=A0ABS8WJK5_DATST|nr:hypothetical protein [Datura stramonium]
MINERLINSERSNDHPHNVAWEGDVYSQVLGNEKSGYVHGLGLDPTPSLLWGRKFFLGNIIAEDKYNEAVKELKTKITELKDLNVKQNEEMSLMKWELSWISQVIRKLLIMSYLYLKISMEFQLSR